MDFNFYSQKESQEFQVTKNKCVNILNEKEFKFFFKL